MATKLTASKLVAMAATQVGYEESPRGSNKSKFGAWYGMNAAPWCAMFVSWCFYKCGDALALIHGKFARTDVKAAALNRLKEYVPGTAGMKKGAVVFFNFGNHSFQGRFQGICHTGIYTGKKTADGRYITIEGNTGSGSDANGGEVQVRYRAGSMIAGYFNPAYAAVKKAVVIKPAAKPKAKTKTRIVSDADGVNMRRDASVNSPKVRTALPKGTHIAVIDENGSSSWFKGKVGDDVGYIIKRATRLH